MSQIEMPNSKATLSAVQASRKRFNGRKGKLLESKTDWAAALCLATLPEEREMNEIDVAVRVALHHAGAEFKIAKERVLPIQSSVGRFLLHGTPLEDRLSRSIDTLMEKAAEKEASDWKLAEEIYEKILPLLPQNKSLLKHQILSLAYAHQRGYRYGAHDDMGLGKTVETLCSLLAAKVMLGRDPFPLVVVTKTSVVGAWMAHIEEWLASIGAKAAKNCDDPSANAIVLSYSRLMANTLAIRKKRPSSMIFDESHVLQDPGSQRGSGAVMCSIDAKNVIVCSATMTPNGRPAEAYFQLKILDKSVNWTKFRNEYCGAFSMTMNGKKMWVAKGFTNPMAFGRLMHKHTFRRTREELGKDIGLLEMPRYVLPIEPSERAMERIRALERELKEKIEKEAEEKGIDRTVDSIEAGSMANVARTAQTLRKAVGMEKIPTALKLAKEHLEEGRRSVLFCFHRDVWAAAVKKATEMKIEGLMFGDASLSEDERKSLVGRAQRDGKVLILTFAYAEGITLTEFDVVMLVERHWIPDIEIQAEARVNRIGRGERPCQANYLQLQGTIDEAMPEVHTVKEPRARAIVASTGVRMWTWLEKRDSE